MLATYASALLSSGVGGCGSCTGTGALGLWDPRRFGGLWAEPKVNRPYTEGLGSAGGKLIDWGLAIATFGMKPALEYAVSKFEDAAVASEVKAHQVKLDATVSGAHVVSPFFVQFVGSQPMLNRFVTDEQRARTRQFLANLSSARRAGVEMLSEKWGIWFAIVNAGGTRYALPTYEAVGLGIVRPNDPNLPDILQRAGIRPSQEELARRARNIGAQRSQADLDDQRKRDALREKYSYGELVAEEAERVGKKVWGWTRIAFYSGLVLLGVGGFLLLRSARVRAAIGTRAVRTIEGPSR